MIRQQQINRKKMHQQMPPLTPSIRFKAKGMKIKQAILEEDLKTQDTLTPGTLVYRMKVTMGVLHHKFLERRGVSFSPHTLIGRMI